MPQRSKSRRKGSKSRRKSKDKKKRGGRRSKAQTVEPAALPQPEGPDAEEAAENEDEEEEDVTEVKVPTQSEKSAKKKINKGNRKGSKGKGGRKGSKGKGGRKGSKEKGSRKGSKATGSRKGSKPSRSKQGSKSKGRKGKSPKEKKGKKISKASITTAGEEEGLEEEEEDWSAEEVDEEAEDEEEEEDEEESIAAIETAPLIAMAPLRKRHLSDVSSSTGSAASSIDDDACISGRSSSIELASTPSSMTLVVPDSRSSDACTILEDMEPEMVTKAAIRKCRGMDDDGEEDERDSDAEESSHQKEMPDFTFLTTYEEYLDHYVTSKDLYYFESGDVARTITTLGFRVPELLTRDQFAELMKEIQTKRFAKRKDDVYIAYGIPPELITCPLMKALAAREKQNRSGNMACLVYIRMMNQKQEEISGWIDFKLRLVKEGADLWTDYFKGKRRLIPRNSDLCYYNWTTFQSRYNSSDNYLVTTDIAEGLQFMNKLDRKLITVNPRVRPGDNTVLVKIKSPNYLDAAIYDHFLRVKA